MPTDRSGGRALPQHGGLHVLARPRVEPRTLPLPDVLEHGAARRRATRASAVTRSGSSRCAAVAAGQRRERHRRVRRPERRRAQVGHAHAERVGDDAGGDDPGRLALVVGGADRRVALDVLHRPQARADRARRMSATVASRCRSTNCVLSRSCSRSGTDHSTQRGLRPRRRRSPGARTGSGTARPQRGQGRSGRAPRAVARGSPAGRTRPSADPATLTAVERRSPGTNAPSASS